MGSQSTGKNRVVSMEPDYNLTVCMEGKDKWCGLF